MSRTKSKFNKFVVTILLAIMLLSGLVLCCAFTDKAEAAGAPPTGIELGCGGEGTRENPYWEDEWNGRITNIDTFGRVTGYSEVYVDINVDPRNIALNDDIIVEFESSYYTTGLGTKKSVEINFQVKVMFYSDGNQVSRISFGKNDNKAGWTRRSGHGDIDQVAVEISVSYNGDSRDIYYVFGTNEKMYKDFAKRAFG